MAERSYADLAGELQGVLGPASTVRPHFPLAKRTTLRVGGAADLYVEPASEKDLVSTLSFAKGRGLPLTVIGRGSNLLIRDGGIRGLVVSLAHESFSRVVVEGAFLRCGAGAKLKAVSIEGRRAGLTGLEFLEGIPGGVGGALRMNAGAMGSSMFDVVQSIRLVDRDGNIEERTVQQVPHEYRCCPLFRTHIAIEAVLKGVSASVESVAERMHSYSNKRWESQPPQPSAGCTFKNPPSIPAGKLIEELGLKGTQRGGAMVSDVHGNFIVNLGNATARDVLELIGVVREKARRERGIELETEVEILGQDLAPGAGASGGS